MTRRMRVLIVEDIEASVEPLKDRIIESFNGLYEIKTVNFDVAKDAIENYRPHVLVLDVFYGPEGDTSKPAGRPVFGELWDKHFCPVIIYSAMPEEIEESHPLVERVRKGRGSTERAVNALKKFHKYVEPLDELQSQISVRLARATRDIAPFAIDVGDPESTKSILIRGARRRVAAMMDQALSEEEGELEPWELYLFPKEDASLRLGDVLRIKDSMNPHDYSVVLTPSCDLAAGGNRKAKVAKALVARCCPIDQLMLPSKAKDRKKKLKLILSQGFHGHFVPLPELPGRIPHMLVNFQSLDLLDLDSATGQLKNNELEVVASIDSPFREAISWAYIQHSGRPGLPDRDFDSWASSFDGYLAQLARAVAEEIQE